MGSMERAKRPFWVACNWSADAGAGSIHDDATAARLGFRGGTVAGNVHLDLCAALLVEEYGKRWFEDGCVSLFFRNPTMDGERVQASCAVPLDGGPVPVWVRRDDGLMVAEGTGSIGDHGASALRTRDLRPVAPESLRILRGVVPGSALGEWQARLDPQPQLDRYRRGLISDPLSWYADASPWGGAIAAVSTAVELLWGIPMSALRAHVGDAVGLFGAIEVAFLDGPLLLGETYRITAEVVALSESPKTESLWFDSLARLGERPVASQRMMLRFMKASSPLYPELRDQSRS